MATVVPIGIGHYFWWRQTSVPTETGYGYRWEKYNDEDTMWLNNEYVGYSLDTDPKSCKHPGHSPIPDIQFVLKEGTDFMFDFRNLLQIRMSNGAANKIMYTEYNTPPSPNDARIDRVPPHAGIVGFMDPDNIYVTHPWNKIIGSALQFAKSRGVARILGDDGIEEFIKTDHFRGCYRQILPPRQLPGGVFDMDPSPTYTGDLSPPPPSTTPWRRRPRRVSVLSEEGSSVASPASPLASPVASPLASPLASSLASPPPSYRRVLANLAKYPIYDPAQHKSK